jgi:hypothetical protein
MGLGLIQLHKVDTDLAFTLSALKTQIPENDKIAQNML